MAFSKEILDLHMDAHLIDLHIDSNFLSGLVGYDFLKRHTAWLPMGALCSHVDLPRMIEGGMDTGGFGVVVNPLCKPEKAWRSTLSQLNLFSGTCKRSYGELVLVGTPEECIKAKQENKKSGFLGLEGAHCLGDDINNVDTAFEKGARYITIAHFSSNIAGACAKGMGADNAAGLSDWGHILVEKMNTLGMMVDVAHVNKKTFLQAVRHSAAPCIASHTGVLGAYELWRNLDDEMIAELVKNNGVMGIIFAPNYISGKLKDNAEAVFRHIDYVVQKYGEDYVGIGSDFDGFIWSTPTNLRDAAAVPVLTKMMLQHGYKEERIRKILGKNVLRVWQDCVDKAS